MNGVPVSAGIEIRLMVKSCSGIRSLRLEQSGNSRMAVNAKREPQFRRSRSLERRQGDQRKLDIEDPFQAGGGKAFYRLGRYQVGEQREPRLHQRLELDDADAAHFDKPGDCRWGPDRNCVAEPYELALVIGDKT